MFAQMKEGLTFVVAFKEVAIRHDELTSLWRSRVVNLGYLTCSDTSNNVPVTFDPYQTLQALLTHEVGDGITLTSEDIVPR